MQNVFNGVNMQDINNSQQNTTLELFEDNTKCMHFIYGWTKQKLLYLDLGGLRLEVVLLWKIQIVQA